MSSSGINIATAQLQDFTEAKVKQLLELRPWMKEMTFRMLSKPVDIEPYIDQCIERGLVALDLETTGLNTRLDSEGNPYIKLVGVCLSSRSDEGIYIPIGHMDKEYNAAQNFVLKQLKRLVANCRVIFHNFKYDGQALRNLGIIIDNERQYEDTYLMAAIEDASRKRKGLKELSEGLLNRSMIELDELGVKGTKKKTIAFDMVPPQKALYYGGSDAMNTYALYMELKRRIDQIDPDERQGPWAIYLIEKRCLFVTMEMERNYTKINRPYLQKLRNDIFKKLEDLEKSIQGMAGRPFDINSPKQLGALLFSELRIPYPIKEKTASGQLKTDEAVLELLREKYPIADMILVYRGYKKLLGTYIDNFLNNADENDEIKFQFNQVQADTGRFSASGGKGLKEDGYCGINAQNIPTYDKTDPHSVDLRRAMIAHYGYKIVSIDYSGEELRIAGNYSREPKWIYEFNEGSADLHTTTAKIITGKDKIIKKERSLAKCVAEGTLVATNRGWLPIEEINPGDEVVTHTGALKKVDSVHEMGVKPAKVIETVTGHKITCGVNHRFLTPDNKWIRAEDLKKGIVVRSASCEKMDPKEPPRIHFNFWDKGTNNKVSDNPPYVKAGEFWGKLLGYLIGAVAKRKKVFKVPDWVFRSPKSVQRVFLQALFETNGIISSKSVISLRTKDKKLARGVLLLLASFGVEAYVHTKASKKHGRDYYHVQMDRYSSETFEKEIGFISAGKKRKLHEFMQKPCPPGDRHKALWVTEIKSVRSLKAVQLYDLTVADDHTYVAEGLVTHNTLNFHTIYGGGAGGFAVRAKIPYEQAKKMLINFFNQYSHLKRWIDREIKACRHRGYSRTAFGRRRPLSEFYDNTDKGIQAKGDRCAINSAVQGAGADILKIVLHRVWKWVRENNLEEDVKIIFPVHDEIVYEIKEEKMDALIPEICEIMCIDDIVKKLGWPIPFTVDAEYGDTFSVDHDFWKEYQERESESKKELEDSSENPEDPDTTSDNNEAGEDVRSDAESTSEHPEPPMETVNSETDGKEVGTEVQGDGYQHTVVAEAANTTSSPGATQHLLYSVTVKDALTGNGGSKKALSDMLKRAEKEPPLPAFHDARIKERIDERGYFNYPLEIDSRTPRKLRYIFDTLKDGKDSLFIGPCYKICILSNDGEVFHRTKEELSIDGFLALCMLFDV